MKTTEEETVATAAGVIDNDAATDELFHSRT